MQIYAINSFLTRLLHNGIMNLRRGRVQSETLVRKTHLLREGGVGLPGGGVPGV